MLETMTNQGAGLRWPGRADARRGKRRPCDAKDQDCFVAFTDVERCRASRDRGMASGAQRSRAPRRTARAAGDAVVVSRHWGLSKPAAERAPARLAQAP